jgi:hypothetical protein
MHRPSFVGHRGQGYGGSESLSLFNLGWDDREQHQATCANIQQDDGKKGDVHGTSQVGASSTPGALSVRRKNFTILEQAALQLQQAFEAMKEPSTTPKQAEEVVKVDKGKAVIDTKPAVKLTLPTSRAEVPEIIPTGRTQGEWWQNIILLPLYVKQKDMK